MSLFKNHNFLKKFFNNDTMLSFFGSFGHKVFEHNRMNFHDSFYGHNQIFDLLVFCIIIIGIVAIVKLLINSKRSKNP